MHELPRNRPAVRRKWIKLIQFKPADFLAAPHHAHLCSEHFSECDFANPMEYLHVEADMMFRCSFKILPDRLKLIRLLSLWVSRAKYQCRLRARVGHFAATPQNDVVGIWVTWFGRHGDASVRQKMLFFFFLLFFPVHYNSQMTDSPTSSFSASLTEIVSKSPLTLDLSFKVKTVATSYTFRTGESN